jgi:hypothetical protein
MLIIYYYFIYKKRKLKDYSTLFFGSFKESVFQSFKLENIFSYLKLMLSFD